MSVKLGVTLPQFTDDPDRFVTGVKAVEDSGLDSAWLFDHLWPLSGGKERPILECWTALATAASLTERIELGSLVTRSTLRHPAVLAKMAATVATIAPGRVIVAIGSGDHMSRDENESFGLDYYEADDRIDQLRSTVTAVHSLLDGGVVSQRDPFVTLDDLPPSPQPPKHVPVWVGGRSDDTLEIAATCADGWNGWGGTAERFAQDAGTVVEMCSERKVELTWGGLMVLRETDDEAQEVAAGRDEVSVWGGPERVAGALKAFADAGATHLIVTPLGHWDRGTVELLAQGVRPFLAGLGIPPRGIR